MSPPGEMNAPAAGSEHAPGAMPAQGGEPALGGGHRPGARHAFRPRVIVTKIGLDGHDRGSRIVAAACRDAGMEVIYTPPWQTIPAVVKLALEEDVDVIGISSLATDHLIVPKLMRALKDAGLGHMAVVVGGIVPDNEATLLIEAGVREVFHPGSTMDVITARIRAYAHEARAASEQAPVTPQARS